MGVVVFAVVAAAHAAVLQVAPREAVVALVAPVVTSPDPVLYEPAAPVVVVELPRVAPVAVPAAAGVAVVVAPQHVRLAAAVALVAPDVQLALHEPDVQRAAAGAAVAQRREAVDAVRLRAVVPQLAAVPLFALPAAQAQVRCLDRDPDARLALETSVP